MTGGGTEYRRARCVESALAKACRLDVVACKPGNVGLHADGHGMKARDFLLSARVAVPCLAAPDARVGERIERAVAVTVYAVGCNTNLGIVLLLAPLAAAALAGGDRPLRETLGGVLDGLDEDDARRCYAAIRRARPAGMGSVAAQDVAAPPTVTLRQAMALAADRDSVARQYVTAFGDVFERGLPALERARAQWRSLAWATTACYLGFLSAMPDSHIVRKHGSAVASDVCARAAEVETALKACENPRLLIPVLAGFDDELKARGVNPGTSADLTVASVAVFLLRTRFSKQ